MSGNLDEWMYPQRQPEHSIMSYESFFDNGQPKQIMPSHARPYTKEEEMIESMLLHRLYGTNVHYRDIHGVGREILMALHKMRGTKFAYPDEEDKNIPIGA